MTNGERESGKSVPAARFDDDDDDDNCLQMIIISNLKPYNCAQTNGCY